MHSSDKKESSIDGASKISPQAVHDARLILKSVLQSNEDSTIKTEENKEDFEKVLDIATDQKLNKKGPIIALTALMEERDELHELLIDKGFVKDQGPLGTNKYRRKESERNILLTAEGEPGCFPIAATVRKLTKNSDPEWVFLFGIAASVDDDVNIGDVVITDTVVDVRRSKIEDGKISLNPKTRQSPGHAGIPTTVKSIEKAIANQYELAKGQDIFEDMIVASANTLSKHEPYMDTVKDTNRKIGAFDMESAGVAQSCAENGVKFYIIRAISDHGDMDKDDSNRLLAKKMAASTVYHGFISGLI